MAGTRKCPHCGVSYEAEAVLCVRCGVDLRTGRHYEQKVELAEEDEPRISPPVWVWLFVREALPGLFRPGVLLLSIAVGALGLVFLAFGVLMSIAFMVVIAGMMIGGLGLVLYAQAAAWLVDGELNLLPDELTDFNSVQWLIFMILVALPFVGFFVLFKVAADRLGM